MAHLVKQIYTENEQIVFIEFQFCELGDSRNSNILYLNKQDLDFLIKELNSFYENKV